MNTDPSLSRIAAIAGTALGIALATALPAHALTLDGDRPACTARSTPAAIRGEAFADRPDLAKILGISGTADVRVDLDPSGNVAATSLARSSGFEILDREALAEARDYRYVAETQNCSSVGGSYVVEVDFAKE